MVFRIDPEIQSYLPKLGPEWYELLKRNIIANHEAGRKIDNLIVLDIAGDHVLGDGHTRKDICEGEGIPYLLDVIKMPTRAAAIEWVIKMQLGRRNLTDEQRSYYRGKLYSNEKQEHGGNTGHSNNSETASGQNDHLKTAERIAKNEGVSPKTIRRDAEFAEGVDQLKPEARAKVLSGEATATKKEISTQIFCPNCKRKGPKSFCRDCAVLRDAEAGKPERNGKPKKEPKSGRLKFDDRKIDDMVGKLTRLFNDRAQALGHQRHQGWKATHTKMSELIEAWEEWQKA